MERIPAELHAVLMRLRREIVAYLQCAEAELEFCAVCHLPHPEGDFESYAFCPWCDESIGGETPRPDESRRIIEHRWPREDEIQCGECGGQYSQPGRYPFRFCPHCGAPFAEEDELLIELPFRV
jgi:uncharacterized CHY-type Zn-finger protein